MSEPASGRGESSPVPGPREPDHPSLCGVEVGFARQRAAQGPREPGEAEVERVADALHDLLTMLGVDPDERQVEDVHGAETAMGPTVAEVLARAALRAAHERAELEALRDVADRLIQFDGGAEVMSWVAAHRHHADKPYIGCLFCRDQFVRRDEHRAEVAREIAEWLRACDGSTLACGGRCVRDIADAILREFASSEARSPDTSRRLASAKSTPTTERNAMADVSMRLCDDAGMVSHEPITDGRESVDRTYLDRLNRLRNMSLAVRGQSPEQVTAPFACTGSAHLAGSVIHCTSPAHLPSPERGAGACADCGGPKDSPITWSYCTRCSERRIASSEARSPDTPGAPEE